MCVVVACETPHRFVHLDALSSAPYVLWTFGRWSLETGSEHLGAGLELYSPALLLSSFSIPVCSDMKSNSFNSQTLATNSTPFPACPSALWTKIHPSQGQTRGSTGDGVWRQAWLSELCLRIHIVEEKSRFFQVMLQPPHVCPGTQVHMPTHTINK